MCDDTPDHCLDCMRSKADYLLNHPLRCEVCHRAEKGHHLPHTWCKTCKVVLYCSSACRRKDASRHRQLCAHSSSPVARNASRCDFQSTYLCYKRTYLMQPDALPAIKVALLLLMESGIDMIRSYMREEATLKRDPRDVHRDKIRWKWIQTKLDLGTVMTQRCLLDVDSVSELKDKIEALTEKYQLESLFDIIKHSI